MRPRPVKSRRPARAPQPGPRAQAGWPWPWPHPWPLASRAPGRRLNWRIAAARAPGPAGKKGPAKGGGPWAGCARPRTPNAHSPGVPQMHTLPGRLMHPCKSRGDPKPWHLSLMPHCQARPPSGLLTAEMGAPRAYPSGRPDSTQARLQKREGAPGAHPTDRHDPPRLFIAEVGAPCAYPTGRSSPHPGL